MTYQRGNVIRYNHIHHTLRYFPGAQVRGIMLDDEYSSVNIEHNVFYDVSPADTVTALLEQSETFYADKKYIYADLYRRLYMNIISI